jgi:hypothetical protein
MGNIEILIKMFLMEKSYSQALHTSIQISRSEEDVNKEALERLEWIERHTTPKIHANFHIIMSYIGRYLGMPLQKELEIKTERGWKEFQVQELIIEVNKAYKEIFSIIMDIAKKYSIDIIIRPTSEIQLPTITA